MSPGGFVIRVYPSPKCHHVIDDLMFGNDLKCVVSVVALLTKRATHSPISSAETAKRFARAAAGTVGIGLIESLDLVFMVLPLVVRLVGQRLH